MVLPSQLQPANATWPKAGARSARMAWERSIESLGIWARGWSSMWSSTQIMGRRQQLRVPQGGAVSWEQQQMELEGVRVADKGKSLLTNTELEVASANV